MTHKSCLNCAYFIDFDQKHEENEKPKPKPWMGFTVSCYLKMWACNLNYIEINVIKDASAMDDFDAKDSRKSFEEIKKEMGDDFTISTVPLSKGKPKELANHDCPHYFPEKKRGAMSHEKCREEQLADKKMAKDDRRFLINTALATLTTIGVIASAIFHFTDWSK